MNSLQLNQILPQTAQSFDSFSSRGTKTENSSFADALKLAQQSDSSQQALKTENQSQQIQNENDVNSSEVSKSVSQQEKADGRISKKDDEKSDKAENKKSSSKEKAAKSESDENENLAASAKNLNQNLSSENPKIAKKVSSDLTKNDKKVANQKKSENSKETKSDKIDEKSLAWLLNSDKIQKNQNVQNQNANEAKNDDFAELIDAAVEFIPGSESDAEKLADAQNLAISDPESFLAQVHELADAEIEGKTENSAEKSEKVSEKKAKSKVTFDVHDLRTAKTQNAENAKQVQKVAAKKEIAAETTQKNDAQNQITLEFAGKVNENITSSSNQAAGSSGSTFQAMLSSSVQENAGEIVKAGNIILKDNNQGSINLILKPEALGNVKISLNLNDKVISGQINVQSQEAFEAFKENLESLKQAFAQSGFETGTFDLNFSQQSFAQSGNNSNGENQAASFFAEKAYGDFVSLGNETKSESSFVDASGRNYSVNIVA